jgi:hypothetical protein
MTDARTCVRALSLPVVKPSSSEVLKRIRKAVVASRHRPFHPGAPAHQRFIRVVLDDIAALQRECPNLDFEPEVTALTSQIVV